MQDLVAAGPRPTGGRAEHAQVEHRLRGCGGPADRARAEHQTDANRDGNDGDGRSGDQCGGEPSMQRSSLIAIGWVGRYVNHDVSH